MVFLTVHQVLVLQRILINETGGSHGVRDMGITNFQSQREEDRFLFQS